jgi:prevent-host-death family protein
VSITTMTSREFNQDVARAKRAAAAGPVFVTDRGRPAFVLTSYAEWALLTGNERSIADALAGSVNAAEVEFDPVIDRSVATVAAFD